MKLNSGDVLMFGGPARLMYHGIDRIIPGTSTLVPGGGRINLTLRRVTRNPQSETLVRGLTSPARLEPRQNKEALVRGLTRASNAP